MYIHKIYMNMSNVVLRILVEDDIIDYVVGEMDTVSYIAQLACESFPNQPLTFFVNGCWAGFTAVQLPSTHEQSMKELDAIILKYPCPQLPSTQD